MCFVWIWEQTAIISLYSINWLVFITETECVYWAVRTGSLNMIQVDLLFSAYLLTRQLITQQTTATIWFAFTKCFWCLQSQSRPHAASHRNRWTTNQNNFCLDVKLWTAGVLFSTNTHNVPPSYNGFLFPCKGKGRAIHVQASTGLIGSKSLRRPDFTTVCIWMW